MVDLVTFRNENVRNLGGRFLQGKGNRGNVEDKGLTHEC